MPREDPVAVEIAMAGARDGREIASLQLAWADEGGLEHDREPFLDAFVQRWVAAFDHRPTWTARGDGVLLGFVSAVRIDALPWPGREDSSWLHVPALYVSPAHRGQGIGSALLDALRAYAEEKGYRLIRLNAAEGAVSLYRAQGYRDDPRAMWLDLRNG